MEESGAQRWAQTEFLPAASTPCTFQFRGQKPVHFLLRRLCGDFCHLLPLSLSVSLEVTVSPQWLLLPQGPSSTAQGWPGSPSLHPETATAPLALRPWGPSCTFNFCLPSFLLFSLV